MNRRELLTGVATVGAAVTAGCGGGVDDEPATLENAYFNVDPPESGSCFADIRFALTYDESPDGAELSPEDTLSPSRGTVIHDDSTDLKWLRQYKNDREDNPHMEEDVPDR